MEQNKEPVEHYYCSEDEWNWLGVVHCRPNAIEPSKYKNVMFRGNPYTDGKNIKGYN